MVKHFIIVSSSYSEGMRIAMHYVVDDFMTADLLSGEIRAIKTHCGEGVSISTHYIETTSPDWNSVVTKDRFFENIEVVDNLLTFIKLISIDRKLKGLDIAKYILSKHSCTHLELEKLVYMCYADYLCGTQKRLFEDEIYAFKYGPVIESVFNEYKGIREITNTEHSSYTIKKDFSRMPARSRILFAEDGIEKLSYVNKTLNKYKGFSASQLVDITHVKDGPWDRTDKSRPFSVITDSTILAHHCKETV